MSIVVFNPNDVSCSEFVEVTLPICDSRQNYEIFDDTGSMVTSQPLETTTRPLATLTGDRAGLFNLLEGVNDGKITGFPAQGLVIQDVKFERKPEALHVYVSVSDFGEPNSETLSRMTPELAAILLDTSLDKFILKADIVSSKARFLVERVPSHGYRTYWLSSKPRPILPQTSSEDDRLQTHDGNPPSFISNEFFKVEITSEEGVFTITDLRNEKVFQNVNRWIDGGDRGDEYNFCEPSRDNMITGEVLEIEYSISPLLQSIWVQIEMPVPAGLDSGQEARSNETLPLAITTTAKLVPGVPRLDIHTEVENQSRDHRLRVHFPFPFDVSYADFDGHFEVVRRPLGVPPYDESWI